MNMPILRGRCFHFHAADCSPGSSSSSNQAAPRGREEVERGADRQALILHFQHGADPQLTPCADSQDVALIRRALGAPGEGEGGLGAGPVC